MTSTLVKMNFDYDKMKLQQIYKNPDCENNLVGLKSKEVRSVYGEDLMFPSSPLERPYLFASLVTSIDGKIAFPDMVEGPLIASKNFLDNDGAMVDWWTLNMLRAAADGIMFGANTLKAEPNSTGHIYDGNLEKQREESGKHPIPWNIIPTLDGMDIPINHKEFTCKQVPVIFYTTPIGKENLLRSFNAKDTVVFGDYCNEDDIDFEEYIPDITKVHIISTGNQTKINNKVGLKVLKRMGLNRILVESPTLINILIKEEMMDELFLNYSCIFVGGDALSIGTKREGFTANHHPHTELISVYMRSPHFVYFRHKLIYNITE